MEDSQNRNYSEEDLRKIEEYKNQFKKPVDNSNSYEKQKINKSNESIVMRIAPFFYMTIVFFITILLLFLIFDKWLMPSMVHNKKLVLVPDVVGKTSEEATQIIHNYGLIYELSGEQYSDIYAEGRVIKQIPNPKTEVKSGRPMFLTISKGTEKVIVPYLLGKSLRDARLQLISRGLKLGNVKYEYSNDFPKDTIMEQSIKSAQTVQYGKTISLVVSKGSEDQVAVPVLIGRRIEEIETILSEYNLKLGNVTYRDSETFMPNAIIETYPSQNSIVQEGTEINIVVSK